MAFIKIEAQMESVYDAHVPGNTWTPEKMMQVRQVGGVQVSELTAGQLQLRDRLGEPHAVVPVRARERHQVLHRPVRPDRPRAHQRLDRFGQLAHQA